MAPNKRLEGKVAIITGSSVGIGEGIALMFAKEGAHVSITGRNQAALDKVAAECKKLGAKVISTTGDLTSDDFLKKLIDHTLSAFGRIDVLVNNAGMITKLHSILEALPVLENFDRTLEVNLRSVYRLCAYAVPHLVKSKGNIINISSVASLKPMPNSIPYCVSKAGLDMLTRCLALELASSQVRVNGVCPGVFKSELHRELKTSEEDEAARMAPRPGWHALGRIGEVEELANCVAFLASDEASFMTGINVPCDGGMIIHHRSP